MALASTYTHAGLNPEFNLYLTNSANKGQKKLDKPLRLKIMESLVRIQKNPKLSGSQLSQPLTQVYSHHLKYKGKEYRIAYLICEDTDSVIVLLVGPHENFYKKLKNVLDSAT